MTTPTGPTGPTAYGFSTRGPAADRMPADVAGRFAAARLWAAVRAPYLTSALFALTPLAHPDGAYDLRGLPADARWNVHLDPGTVRGTPVPELGWWLIHQVGHLLRGHHARAPEPPGTTWAQAADAEVNDDLDDAPPGVVTPDALGLPPGLMAERYRDLLALDDAPAGLLSCALPPYTGPGVMPAPEQRLLVRAVAAEIHARGDAPGRWRRWAEQALRPEVDWRARLASLVRRVHAVAAGRVDHTYRRPSRRSAAVPGVVLPALVRPVPRVAVVVDTSGSVPRPTLARMLAELGGVLRASGHRGLDVICCDTEAYPVQRVTSAAQVRLTGGGGTDLRPGLAAAAGADLVVVLTDGHTPWPDRPPPRATVILCLYTPTPPNPPTARMQEHGDPAPPWARVARVKGGGDPLPSWAHVVRVQGGGDLAPSWVRVVGVEEGEA